MKDNCAKFLKIEYNKRKCITKCKEDSIHTEDTRKFVEEKTKEILNAGSCCPELKEMAEKWLAAEGTTDEKAVTEAYLQELSEDVLPIDALISFASSEKGAEVFGAEQAKSMAEAGKHLKRTAVNIVSARVSAGGAILDKKNEIL